MSSALKDARWQLAKERAADVGLDLFEVPYEVQAKLLANAQSILDHSSASYMDQKAKEWSKPDPE